MGWSAQNRQTMLSIVGSKWRNNWCYRGLFCDLMRIGQVPVWWWRGRMEVTTAKIRSAAAIG